AQTDYTGDALPLNLDSELTANLRSLSRQAGTTLYMTLLVAWSALLARLTNQNDLLIGSPSANRGRREIEPLIGFFVNTLPLRIQLHEEPSALQLLARVKELTLAAQANQDIPFEQIVELLQPQRSLAHHPLVQVIFAWESATAVQPVVSGLNIQPATVSSSYRISKFDLSLSLQEEEQTVSGSIEYPTALFDASTVQHYRQYFLQLLRGMCQQPHTPIGQLSILPQEERELVLQSWNNTAVEYPRDLGVHQLFEQQVERTPDAIALVFEEQTLTYAQLNQQANQLAHHLRSFALQPDDRVALCLERGFPMVIAALAILKAGAAYLPLDPAYPSDRLDFMLRDAKPRLLLTQDSLAELLATQNTPVLLLDSQAHLWQQASALNIASSALALTPHHLAYVIYTSGSTGLPKGAMVEHKSLANLIAAQIEALGLAPTSRTLQFAPFSFDASVFEIFPTLCAGASLLLRRQSEANDTASVQQLLRDKAISHVTLPAAVLASFSDDVPLPALQTLVLAGDVLPPHLAARWRSGRRLINAYGPTESTICATM
ncbi:MAG TPA: AMP-binding protein, partial [Ktedonobacteraceae bacterium]|nr:AMP-binding protein [Ktedonobacteraceae bacterium]